MAIEAVVRQYFRDFLENTGSYDACMLQQVQLIVLLIQSIASIS
jgi:hypothetical protein